MPQCPYCQSSEKQVKAGKTEGVAKATNAKVASTATRLNLKNMATRRACAAALLFLLGQG
jgi:hypothetical protein